MEERTTVAIIGAGPAGLAVGTCLRRAGVDFVILEKASEIACTWRRHYARLHLHTVKSRSALPFAPFPKDYPRYASRQQVIDYLETYVARFELRPRFGETVRAVDRDGNAWRVEATSVTLHAPHVVIASGLNAEPVTPHIGGLDAFRGHVIHSGAYTDAARFADGSVLIVGMGNTGAEIALELAETGARPTISVRDGVHIVPRELFGVPIQLVATLATRLLPDRINDRIFPPILDFALGNLETYGIKRPKLGLLQQIATSGRIPVIDVGTVRRIRDGAIKIAPDISVVTADGARFADGTSGSFDAIILATGYRPGYRAFLATEDVPTGAGPREPQLYFVGFKNPVTGLLREIGLEAQRVADAIHTQSAKMQGA